VLWIATKWRTIGFVEDAILPGIATAHPKSNTWSGLSFAGMEGGREISEGFAVIPPCFTEPRPTLILSFDINVIPKPLNCPVPQRVKFCYVD